MTATKGWRRAGPGSYTRGMSSIRRIPDPHAPDRPWIVYAATVPRDGGGAWEVLGRFHTLRLAQQAASRHERTPT